MTEDNLAEDTDIAHAPEDDLVVDHEKAAAEMFERNMETFGELLPRIRDRIMAHTPVSKLVFGENGEPNVEFNGATVYDGGATTVATSQHEQYGKYSQRLRISPFGPDSLDVHAKSAYTRLTKRLDESGITFNPLPTGERCYFTLCFGIGLGQHLDQLAERTDCWVLVLIEPNLDFLYHSCSVYDWRPLMERMRERRAIEFQIGNDTMQIIANLHGVFRAHHPVGLDGTTIFRHYSTGLIKEIEREFSGKVMTSIMGLGFFQDEINMISQTYKNLEGGKTRLIKAVRESPNIPVMIIANGPSLDHCIDLIRENQDKVVLIACGSAITTLGEHGIMPDFWVMTERIKAILEMVEDADERFGVEDVVFIGSSTVFPGVTSHFKDFILFFRPGLSSMPLFSTRGDQILKIPDPLAANSGLAAALHLGFREFYFAGVDVGSRYSDRGHASGGFYANREDHIKTLDIPVPANFGGTVYTTPVLKWSRENLEKLTLSSVGRTFYNLSDGALIERATPLHPKVAKFKEPPKPKKEIVAELTKKCEIYTTEEFTERWEDEAIVDSLPEFCEKMKEAMSSATGESLKYARDVSELLRPAESHSARAMLIRGSTYTFMIASEYWVNRVVHEAERELVYRIYREEFQGLMDRLSARATEVFEGLEDGKPWLEEFVE